MRLTLVIPGLRGGGAERVLSTLANAWAERGNFVTLLTYDYEGPKAYEISGAIDYKPMPLLSNSSNLLGGLTANLRRLHILRAAIRESLPDVVVSFISSVNILTICATVGLQVPVIVSERSDPSQFAIDRVWSVLRRLTYPHADAVVCQTENVAAKMRRYTVGNQVIIPNPITFKKYSINAVGDGKTKHIFAMGRLDPIKGFDLLLHAFRLVSSQFPDWSLTILGEGPERERLQQLIVRLGLVGQVAMPGWVPDPFTLLTGAELFVLSSRVEGFPNALCEAMACGLPVIAFDCESGPSDIVRNEVDGLLVPPQDVSALATAMERLMSDPEERSRFRLRATEVVQRFGIELVLQQWNNIFRQVGAAGSRKALSNSFRGFN